MRKILKRQTGQPGFYSNKYVREKEVKFRVSFPEYEQICEIAQESEYNSLAQFMRESLLTPSDEIRPIEQKKLKAEAMYEASRIGNSLNQIAKHCNEHRTVDLKTAAEIQKIRKIMKQICEKI